MGNIDPTTRTHTHTNPTNPTIATYRTKFVHFILFDLILCSKLQNKIKSARIGKSQQMNQTPIVHWSKTKIIRLLALLRLIIVTRENSWSLRLLESLKTNKIMPSPSRTPSLYSQFFLVVGFSCSSKNKKRTTNSDHKSNNNTNNNKRRIAESRTDRRNEMLKSKRARACASSLWFGAVDGGTCASERAHATHSVVTDPSRVSVVNASTLTLFRSTYSHTPCYWCCRCRRRCCWWLTTGNRIRIEEFAREHITTGLIDNKTH